VVSAHYDVVPKLIIIQSKSLGINAQGFNIGICYDYGTGFKEKKLVNRLYRTHIAAKPQYTSFDHARKEELSKHSYENG
jgi:hypothetical protein